MLKKNDKWWKVYESLDLCGGELQTISDDDEDMITITYLNGIIIDVGYISNDKKYYITVVKDDSIESWNSPIMIIEELNKTSLPTVLQNIIFEVKEIVC